MIQFSNCFYVFYSTIQRTVKQPIMMNLRCFFTTLLTDVNKSLIRKKEIILFPPSSTFLLKVFVKYVYNIELIKLYFRIDFKSSPCVFFYTLVHKKPNLHWRWVWPHKCSHFKTFFFFSSNWKMTSTTKVDKSHYLLLTCSIQI